MPATWASQRAQLLAHAKREGWTRQIESSKALAKREDAPLAVTPVEAVAMSMQQRAEHHIERMAGVSERGVDHIERMDGPEILNSVDQIGFTLNVLNINSLDVRTGESGNTE